VTETHDTNGGSTLPVDLGTGHNPFSLLNSILRRSRRAETPKSSKADDRAEISYNPSRPFDASEEVLALMVGRQLGIYYDSNADELIKIELTSDDIFHDPVTKQALRSVVGRLFSFTTKKVVRSYDRKAKRNVTTEIQETIPVPDAVLSEIFESPRSTLARTFPPADPVKELARSPFLVEGFIAFAEDQRNRFSNDPAVIHGQVTMGQLHPWMKKYFDDQGRSFKNFPPVPAEMGKRLKRLVSFLASIGLKFSEPVERWWANVWNFTYYPQRAKGQPAGGTNSPNQTVPPAGTQTGTGTSAPAGGTGLDPDLDDININHEFGLND